MGRLQHIKGAVRDQMVKLVEKKFVQELNTKKRYHTIEALRECGLYPDDECTWHMLAAYAREALGKLGWERDAPDGRWQSGNALEACEPWDEHKDDPPVLHDFEVWTHHHGRLRIEGVKEWQHHQTGVLTFIGPNDEIDSFAGGEWTRLRRADLHEEDSDE